MEVLTLLALAAIVYLALRHRQMKGDLAKLRQEAQMADRVAKSALDQLKARVLELETKL